MEQLYLNHLIFYYFLFINHFINFIHTS